MRPHQLVPRPSSSMARVIRRGTERAGCEQGDKSRNRYGGADRWRRACRPDARHGLGLARRRCHGRRASPGRGARRASSVIRSQPARWRSSAASASPQSCVGPGFRRTIRTTSPPARRRRGSNSAASVSPRGPSAMAQPTGRTRRGPLRSLHTGSIRFISNPYCSRTLRPNHASAYSTALCSRISRRTATTSWPFFVMSTAASGSRLSAAS